MAKVSSDKEKRRVWIDSQTEEEIKRGIKEAKLLSEYDNLSSAAYLRAKSDYLMGINFSRVLSLKYGRTIMDYLNNGKWSAVSVGRVMTCVLGMVVKREREIRDFVKTPFYRVIGNFGYEGQKFEGEWRAVKGSQYFESHLLYKENGFNKKEDAQKLIDELKIEPPAVKAVICKAEKKKEKKNPPLLFNLAELQNTCSKLFKISPDETLKIVQELYEKKLVTYPRTDARVLSTAVAKEIYKNISGLRNYAILSNIASGILESQSYKGIEKTKYVNDKQIADHYAIIPTGQGFNALNSISQTASKVYEVIVRRFLCIFYPSAEYLKINIIAERLQEHFFASFKILTNEGYLAIATASFAKQKITDRQTSENNTDGIQSSDNKLDENAIEKLKQLKNGMEIELFSAEIKEGETSPPKRYNSGSMILAMENAGQLIEDEDLRAQIKGSGIGTSATRAEILSKLVNIKYLSLNKKTQIITPTLLGEMVHDVVFASIHALLNPELTASWELGLTMVADGKITEDEYMMKLNKFITSHVQNVKNKNYQNLFKPYFDKAAANYKTSKKTAKKTTAKSGTDNSKTKNKQA